MALRLFDYARTTADRPILRNAASLFGSTIITSLLGFAFWLVAARMLQPVDVGIASAVVSAAQLIGFVCIFGLGTLVIAEFADSHEGVRRLLAATIILTGLAGLAIGLVVGVLLVIVSPSFRLALQGAVRLIVFALLCATGTVGLLLDDASVGLLRGDIQLRRNAAFAAGKLLMLPILVVLWSTAGGIQLTFAWLFGVLVSLLIVGPRLRRATPFGSWLPDFRRLVAKRRLIYAHHWLNISMIAPSQLFPLLVAGLIGPVSNAAFYSAMLIVGFVNAVPTSLSTALFALKAGDNSSLREEVLRGLQICLIVSVISGGFLLGFSRFVLDVFRPSYASAAPTLALLGLTTFPASIKAHYVAIARVRGRMRQAALNSTAGALLEVAAVAAGATTGNLTWVATALILALAVQGLLFAPTVVRAIRYPVAINAG